jgi:hypothetical protein
MTDLVVSVVMMMTFDAVRPVIFTVAYRVGDVMMMI